MFKKGDIITVAIALLLTAVLVFALTAFRRPGAVAEVTVGDEVYGRYPLSSDIEVEIKSDGSNLLVIKDGKASIISADCPDKICVHHAAVSRVGEVIVCLPHRLAVTIKEG